MNYIIKIKEKSKKFLKIKILLYNISIKKGNNMQINNQIEIYEFKSYIILATGCFITIYSKRQFKKLLKKPLVIHDWPTKIVMNDEEWDKITGYRARITTKEGK